MMTAKATEGHLKILNYTDAQTITILKGTNKGKLQTSTTGIVKIVIPRNFAQRNWDYNLFKLLNNIN